MRRKIVTNDPVLRRFISTDPSPVPVQADTAKKSPSKYRTSGEKAQITPPPTRLKQKRYSITHLKKLNFKDGLRKSGLVVFLELIPRRSMVRSAAGFAVSSRKPSMALTR
jgi:hypothetical protein